MKAAISLLIAIVAVAWSPHAAAQQQLYKETPGGWFIYREPKSCVAYANFPSGTMLRFSNRTEQNRMYFSAYNSQWEHLRPLSGRTVTLHLNFGSLGRIYSTAAAILENPDGRMGFSGADLSNSAILLALAGGTSMALQVMYEGSKKTITVENFRLSGGDMASVHLTECSEKFF